MKCCLIVTASDIIYQAKAGECEGMWKPMKTILYVQHFMLTNLPFWLE